MKFVPRTLSAKAADASRGHDRSPLRELAILLLSVGAIFLALYVIVVLAVDQVVLRLSPQREAEIFAAFSTALPPADDLGPDLTERFESAQQLMTQLHDQSGLREVPLQLVVWDDPGTNAWAVPGGTIALTIGLLQSVEQESAMAFVLAHEIGHFEHRDHLRGLGRQVGFQVVKSLLFSGHGGVAPGTDQLGTFTYLSHSRDAEADADRYALELVYQTFESTGDAGRILETLDAQSLPGWAYMFSSHPAADERIAALREYAAELNDPERESE